MKGKRLLIDYFRGRPHYLRRFIDNVEPGETLTAREIAERAGIIRTKTYGFMRLMEERGMVETVPFVWPKPPPQYADWGKRKRRHWRRDVRGTPRGPPGIRWRFLGLIVTPIDELVKLANLDLGGNQP